MKIIFKLIGLLVITGCVTRHTEVPARVSLDAVGKNITDAREISSRIENKSVIVLKYWESAR